LLRHAENPADGGTDLVWELDDSVDLASLRQGDRDSPGEGERFIRRLIAERRISYVKIGKFVRLQRSTLDAFIEAGRIPSE
jgi:excisionase family DNA binding protein